MFQDAENPVPEWRRGADSENNRRDRDAQSTDAASRVNIVEPSCEGIFPVLISGRFILELSVTPFPGVLTNNGLRVRTITDAHLFSSAWSKQKRSRGPSA